MNSKTRRTSWILAILSVIVLTGCHPIVTPTPSAPPVPAFSDHDSEIDAADNLSSSPTATHVAETNLEPATGLSTPITSQQRAGVLGEASTPGAVILASESLTVTVQITDTALAAFTWSYSQLLSVWNPVTGLVRSKAEDASGEFDVIQATGSLAAATALAEQLGVIGRGDAIRIVNRISHALLVETPRYHGLWPQFVETSPDGVITIVTGTEWSSVDTVIAAIGLLTAQHALGLDTYGAEQMLQAVDWDDLTGGPEGMIAQGYTAAGERFPSTWDVFGTESWLVELAYAAVTGRVAPMANPTPPTANGSGFIDELAWLFVLPPSEPDYWGTDWPTYRSSAVNQQIDYYPANFPTSCFAQAGLFGLSAAEAPDLAGAFQGDVYQTFGVGGRLFPANDGSASLGGPVVTPHYAAMIAALRPLEALANWDWLITYGFFSPQTSVESLMFREGSSCDPSTAVWNRQISSWNLALQTLGWGRYLAQRRGLVPALWQAATENPLLRDGYHLLAPSEASRTPDPTWSLSRECEDRAEVTVGQTMERPNASGLRVHGQFGTLSAPPWSPQPGWARYTGLTLPQTDHLYLRLRYSKFSPPSVPILIYLDDEPAPRAERYPIDLGSWDTFTWTEPILLGSIMGGTHTITFATAGQSYGVADLDLFILANEPPVAPAAATPANP